MVFAEIIFQFGEFMNESSWLSDFLAVLLAIIIPFIVLYVQITNDKRRKNQEIEEEEDQFYNHFIHLGNKCIKTIDQQIKLIDEFVLKFDDSEPCVYRVSEIVKSDLKNFLNISNSTNAFNIVRKRNKNHDGENTFYQLRYSVERSLEVMTMLKETNNQYLILTNKSIEKLKLKVEEELIFDITNYIQSLEKEKTPPSNIDSIKDYLNQYYQHVIRKVKAEEPVTAGDLHVYFLVPMTHSMVSLKGYPEAERLSDRLRSANWIYGTALSDQEEFLSQVANLQDYLVEDRNKIESTLKLMEEE